MQGIKVTIVRYVSDNPQPGIVECQLEDAHGRRWSIVEKTAVVSVKDLDAQTTYPQQGFVACAIVGRSFDSAGREVVRIDAGLPWGVESVEGVTQFDVLPESLVEW
jgi:hypothetical protein